MSDLIVKLALNWLYRLEAIISSLSGMCVGFPFLIWSLKNGGTGSVKSISSSRSFVRHVSSVESKIL